MENPGLQLIMAILPERDKQIYPEIKRVGDNVIGIPTQCVQSKHVHRTNPQVCANIALKINSKLGGINHVIDPGEKSPVFRESVIIFGTDLTHPSLNENGIPSIAAVAASMDANATKYCARVRAQNHRNGKGAQEIINDLAEIVKKLLIEFYRARSSSTVTESVRVSLTKFLLMRCGLYNRPVLCLKKIIARESLLLWFRSAIIRDCSVKTNEMKLAKQGMFLLVQQWTAVSHIRMNSTFICAVIMESRYISFNMTCRVFTLRMVIGSLIILCQTNPYLSLGTL